MGRLFFAKLQEEGKLQKGDDVMVDGKPAVVHSIRSASEIVVDYHDGNFATLKGLDLGADAVVRSVS